MCDYTDLITCVGGLFQGNQLNWVTLMKEVYAIYMSVKRLSFYLTDGLRSDHLPLKRFLQMTTLNLKVSICGVN